MSNLREKAIEIAKQTSFESALMCGYDLAVKEYEEKLRWKHVFEELPDLNSVIELKSENKRFLGIVKLKNYQGENRYYVQGMYQATGDIDILYNFSHWRKAIL